MADMETNDTLDLNKTRIAEEREIDRLLSSTEFRDKAMTAEDHHHFMDNEWGTRPYPGAVVEVSNMHMALSIVRRLYKEVGARSNKDADNAFKHETAHFAEALNHGVDEKDAKIRIYLLKEDENSGINGIELRIGLPLPDNMSESEKTEAIAKIALAPEYTSPQDRKLAGI